MKLHLLTAAILFQMAVLGGEYLNSVYPLWYGEQVQLALRPVDPRSLFRGNYAELNYTISNLKGEEIVGNHDWRRGQVVYVSLALKGEYHEAISTSPEEPEEGLFIRGRIGSASEHHIRVDFNGINAYFAPKEKALSLEKEARRVERDGAASAYAEVRLTSSGRPALEEVRIVEPQGERELPR